MRQASTTEIIARKSLQRPCGIECVEWAVGLLERGVDSRSVRILSSMAPPFNHFEIAELRDRVLAELGAKELSFEHATAALAAIVLKAALEGRTTLRAAFTEAAQLAIECDYPRELQPLYELHFAAEDLQYSGMQWYWQGATRDNIDRIMREEAERFVSDRAV